MNLHILIIGANGQLGQAMQIVYAERNDCRVTSLDMPEIDITRPETIKRIIDLQPDAVINAAAWTNVDAAEENEALVYAVNAMGPHHLASACEQCGAQYVQVSTNEVFAGEIGRRYYEYDTPSPGGVYARSKFAGERAALLACKQTMITRLAWLYAPGGNNFPAKISAAADRYGKLRVVDDEIGNPTYAPDAAWAIAELIDKKLPGIYHMVNEGQASRFEFASEILRLNGRGHIPLTPIPSSEWPRTAPPPLHAVIVNQAAAALNIRLRPWQEALAAYSQAEQELTAQ